VLCSTSEGMSAALAEAMAAGLPVVSTEVSGSRDLIRDGENGFLVPVGDHDALADRILRIMGKPALASALGEAARRDALDKLDIRKVAEKHLALYGDLVARTEPPRPGCAVRVAHIIATLDAGGSEHQMARLVAELDRKLFEPFVICLTRLGPVARELQSAGVPYLLIGKRGKLDVPALLRLAAVLRRLRPRIVHTWLFTSNSLGRAAALIARVPVVFACERSTDPWKRPWHAAVDRALARCTRTVFANSESVRDALIARGVPAAKIGRMNNIVLPSGDRKSDRQETAAGLGLPSGVPLVGYVGRLSEEKGPGRLLDVMELVRRELPETSVAMVGDGPARRELQKRVDRLSWCVLTGYRADPRPFYRAFDVVALLSDYEGMPNTLLEAMGEGTPGVAFDVGGVGELARASGAVVRVQAGDVRAAAGAIVALLRDPGRGLDMGRRGMAYIERHHRAESVTNEMSRVYLEQSGLIGCAE